MIGLRRRLARRAMRRDDQATRAREDQADARDRSHEPTRSIRHATTCNAAGSGTANRLRAFREDLQLQRVQSPRLVSGTVNRSVMLDTVLRALASAQGSSAIPRMFCTVLRYELVS